LMLSLFLSLVLSLYNTPPPFISHTTPVAVAHLLKNYPEHPRRLHDQPIKQDRLF
jgi:hypothetical protein